jgi:hypothetical protein
MREVRAKGDPRRRPRAILGPAPWLTPLVAVALLALAAAADASRAPTASERDALHKEARLLYPADIRDQVITTNVRVSTKGPYAKARIVARPGAPDADQIQGAVGLFKRDSKGRWHFTHAMSSEGYPCSVPKAVRRDLRLSRYGTCIP